MDSQQCEILCLSPKVIKGKVEPRTKRGSPGGKLGQHSKWQKNTSEVIWLSSSSRAGSAMADPRVVRTNGSPIQGHTWTLILVFFLFGAFLNLHSMCSVDLFPWGTLRFASMELSEGSVAWALSRRAAWQLDCSCWLVPLCDIESPEWCRCTAFGWSSHQAQDEFGALGYWWSSVSTWAWAVCGHPCLSSHLFMFLHGTISDLWRSKA